MRRERREAIPERIRQARRDTGLTQEQASERARLSRNTIAAYENNRFRPSESSLTLLAVLYDKPYEWFFGEEEKPQRLPPPPNDEAPESAAQSEPGTPDAIVSLDEVSRDLGARFDRLESYVRSAVGERRAEYDAGGESPIRDPVDVNEVAAAAGGGAVVFDETVVGRLWFRRDWLASHAIDPKQCNVISVRGESMEPILPSGSSILVDRSQGRRRRRVGRIFVLRTEDGLVVKRVGRDEEGNWLIESEHPAWPPVPWSDTTEIVGEVRWLGRTF